MINNNCLAQDKIAETILSNISTIEDEKYTPEDTNNILYILITNKTCSKCFVELCDNIHNSQYNNHKIKVIGTMKYDLLKMITYAAYYGKLVPCQEEVLFHFTDKNLVPSVYESPSPQLVIKNKNELRYYTYGLTMELVKSFSENDQ